jgi:hypothetical protein
MEEFQKHVLERLTNVEEELRELRAVTWPVCQAQLDEKNNLKNIVQKKTLLRWLDLEEVSKLLRLKGLIMKTDREMVNVELRQIVISPN